MPSDGPHDESRAHFLATLTDALDSRWSAERELIRPFGVLGIRLRCAGVEGSVQIVPSVVSDNAVSWDPFPGSGRPHFDIAADGGGTQRTCIVAHATRILETWALSKSEVVRTAPVPMLPLMRPRLEAIAAAPLAPLEEAIDAERWTLSAVAHEAVAAARAELDPAAVARAFPRDADGRRLALGTRALLVKLESGARVSRGRAVYLAVQGPQLRRDGERLELAIVDVIAENESHDWMAAPWFWRHGVQAPAIDARATEYCELVDAGRFDEALTLFEITMTPSVIRILEGVPLSSRSEYVEADRHALRRTLWELAPWQLSAKGYGRLSILPHQRAQVKAWFGWDGSRRHITTSESGTNERMAEVYWKRSVDYDLARLGIARAVHASVGATTYSVPSPVRAKRARAKVLKSFAELIAGKELWKVDAAEKEAKQRPVRAVMQELLAIVNGGAPHVERANALYIAARIADDQDGPALVRLIADREFYVQRMAIEGVKRLAYQNAIPALAALINQGQSKARDLSPYAITALRALSGTRGASGMVRYFTSMDPRVREAACRSFTISADGHKLIRPHLERALKDADPQVTAAAELALAVLDENAKNRAAPPR